MKHWHVLFVLGGYEETIMKKINQQSDAAPVEAFLPKVEKMFKKKGQVSKVEYLLFKNYVFVQTDLEYKDFNLFLEVYVKSITGFIKLLKHDTEGTESLYPEERDFLERFTNKWFSIEKSVGFIEGDQVIIMTGPLAGFESMIKKINRHKQIAILEVSMFGSTQDIEVGLEIISKTP